MLMSMSKADTVQMTECQEAFSTRQKSFAVCTCLERMAQQRSSRLEPAVRNSGKPVPAYRSCRFLYLKIPVLCFRAEALPDRVHCPYYLLITD